MYRTHRNSRPLSLPQYSAYIMDERFPSVPMLKWDHMMNFPPVFCHVVPGSTSSGSVAGADRTTKVLLGSHSSQEITLLQYSGQLTAANHAAHFEFIFLLISVKPPECLGPLEA